MWNGALDNRDFNNILLAVFYALCNSVLNFVRFAEPVTDMSFFIAYYNNCVKSKTLSAFYNLSCPVDMNKLLFQI